MLKQWFSDFFRKQFLKLLTKRKHHRIPHSKAVSLGLPRPEQHQWPQALPAPAWSRDRCSCLEALLPHRPPSLMCRDRALSCCGVLTKDGRSWRPRLVGPGRLVCGLCTACCFLANRLHGPWWVFCFLFATYDTVVGADGILVISLPLKTFEWHFFSSLVPF